MPRAPRIETNQAVYHVINRGNYRSAIFSEEGAKAAFERCLFEACERFGWRLHGYCILDNHFHLCIATPRGNLSDGMRWLQGTYAARYNRMRKEAGHLFQGRFKSLIVEPGSHLCDLIDYIHLNPARAGVADSSKVGQYPWSSLHWFPKKKRRPGFLDATWLSYRDSMTDSATGWRNYTVSLRMRASEDAQEIAQLETDMCRGWCIGSRDFKQAHAKELLSKRETLRLEKEGLADLNESHWSNALETCLKTLGESEASAKASKYSAEWKLAVATKLRQETSVKNAWLSEHLHMGVPRGVSSLCGVYAKRKDDCPYFTRLANLTFDV